MKAQHGFYRDYVIREEGVYKINLLSLGERVIVEVWPFAFLAVFWLTASLIFFALFVVTVLSELYVPKLIGNQKRKMIYAKPDQKVTSSGIFIPWNNISSVELSPKTIIFSLGGKVEGGRINHSDFGVIRDFLLGKVADRLVLKQDKN